MLLHFSGLLSLSFNSGLNFLVKGCISMMMALMNLFVFEEGDLLALRSLLATRLEAFPSKLSDDEVQEVNFIFSWYKFIKLLGIVFYALKLLANVAALGGPKI